MRGAFTMRAYNSLVFACALLASACGDGGGNEITGPSNRIPSVAGNYSGTTSITFPELSRTVTCPTTTSVTQSGSTVSIAPLQLSGQCGALSIPFGQMTIDTTGALGQDTGSFFEPSCGGTYNYSGSGGFFGRDLRLSAVYTSRTCYNMNFTINLTRS
jgi:hypothetical protein